MSKYEKKFQRIENGNWLVKSAALMGIWILAMAGLWGYILRLV